MVGLVARSYVYIVLTHHPAAAGRGEGFGCNDGFRKDVTMTDEDFMQLKDAVRDLASHVSAAFNALDEGLATVAEGQTQPNLLLGIRARIQRTNSHVADVRKRLEGQS